MKKDEKQKEHQFCSGAPKEKSVGGDFLSSHKDKNLDELSQEYIDGVKQYNHVPTWDLMQTAVCYGYHLAESELGWHPSIEHPPVDEEVIVLLGRYDDFPKIAIGHIVDQSIAIDFNGWNIPGVMYWMPMPKLPN